MKSVDAQPSGNGILVFVNGDLKVDDNANVLKFAQVFQLIPTDQSLGNFWIFNDVFR